MHLLEGDLKVYTEMVRAAREFGVFAGCKALAKRAGWKTACSVTASLVRLEKEGYIVRVYKGRRVSAFILQPYGYRLPVRSVLPKKRLPATKPRSR